MKQIWIVKGEVTDADMWSDIAGRAVSKGDVEWQFSDGPPGERGSSADYLDLADGLRHHAPAIFHFAE